MDDVRDFEQRLGTALDRLAGPHRPFDAMGIAHTTLTARGRRRAATRFDSIGFAAATVVVALGAGLAAVAWFSTLDDARPSVGTPPSHAATMEPEAPAAQAVDWDAGAARLEADAFELRSNGRVILTGADPVFLEADARQPTVRALRINFADRYDAFLELHLKRDAQSWWVRGLNFHDGSDNIWFHKVGSDKLWETPLGEPFEGDARFEGSRYNLYGPGGVPVELVIEGMRLTSFLPGTGAAALDDCTPATDHLYVDVLGGADSPVLAAMSPAEVETYLDELGVCHQFSFERGGYWEGWCTAPPEGTFESVALDHRKKAERKPDRLVVYYHDGTAESLPPRPQPPAGWNCPTE